MDFRLTSSQLELRDRADALTSDLQTLEDRCETHSGLDAQSHQWATERIRHHALNAINMPARWGGQGLSTFDQVIVQSSLTAASPSPPVTVAVLPSAVTTQSAPGLAVLWLQL